MKIARCLDEHGARHWIEPLSDTHGRVLAGDPLAGGLQPTGETVQIDSWLAPLDPVAIFGIGLNYRAHAAETGAPLPEHPVMFMKPPSAVLGHAGTIRLPGACEHGPEVDFEAELAVVIGRRARDVAANDALDYVLGYTAANDVSARRWQKHAGGGQWVRGKSFDTFCPLGPVLVTANELGDPQGLEVCSRVNGRIMQQGNTADMIFPVAELIAFVSRDTTLMPGTVLLTGTPAGVGFTREPPVFLAAGDEVEIVVGGIGILRNRVADAAPRRV